MDPKIHELTEKIELESQFIDTLFESVSKVIVGQKRMLERLMVGLLADGHILLEGVPGLAKTTAIKSLAAAISVKFQRIQFTPDLLPADLIGTLIYNQKTGGFFTRKGPVFTNFILADEINRAPAKVQSALLEAMQERQVTIGEETFQLESPFLVLATQNPIEQEGTYPLPEAQVDRFMLKVVIDYPSRAEELQIMRQQLSGDVELPQAIVSPEEILRARKTLKEIYLDPKIEDYILDLVFATREPEKYGLEKINDLIEYGASPRATIYLAQTAKAYAFLKHRGYVIPEDIRSIGMDVLRHRVMPTYEAEAEELTSEDIIKTIFDTIEVP